MGIGRCMDGVVLPCCVATPHSFISIAAVGRPPQYSQSVAVSRSSALAFSTPAWSPRRYLLSAAWRTANLL